MHRILQDVSGDEVGHLVGYLLEYEVRSQVGLVRIDEYLREDMLRLDAGVHCRLQPCLDGVDAVHRQDLASLRGEILESVVERVRRSGVACDGGVGEDDLPRGSCSRRGLSRYLQMQLLIDSTVENVRERGARTRSARHGVLPVGDELHREPGLHHRGEGQI